MFQSERFISVSESDLTVNLAQNKKKKEAAIPTLNKFRSIKLFWK